jgi:hypothetical protein
MKTRCTPRLRVLLLAEMSRRAEIPEENGERHDFLLGKDLADSSLANLF